MKKLTIDSSVIVASLLMDALVIQVAKDFGNELITLGEEMMEKSKPVFE